MAVQGVRSKELESRCRLLSERLSDSARILDHDPSLALYRLQEHIGRSLGLLVHRRIALDQTAGQLQLLQATLDSALQASESMSSSSSISRGVTLMREAVQKAQELPNSARPPHSDKRRSKSFHGQRRAPS